MASNERFKEIIQILQVAAKGGNRIVSPIAILRNVRAGQYSKDVYLRDVHLRGAEREHRLLA